jgi:flagellin-specific chaperone FliS
VREKINHLVHEYVAVAKNLVANLQMSEAEENISRLSDLLKSLNKLRVIDEETQRAITELKCNQKELSVIEKFQEMNLEESLIRIAEVYESLTKYPQSLDEVNKLITNKLKTKLADTSGKLLAEKMSKIYVFVKMRLGLRWTSPDFLGLLLFFVEIMPDKVILDHKKSYLVNLKIFIFFNF